VLRPTAQERPLVTPRVWREATGSFPVTHPYVRRYWTAAIGPGAVADLLRLATAARRGRSLRRPVHLPVLVAAGLVLVRDGSYHVATTVPALPASAARRLPPALLRQHRLHRSEER
jgi:hypothetical protein